MKYDRSSRSSWTDETREMQRRGQLTELSLRTGGS